MLLATVVLWALNLTVTRYILTHGFEPLAYATVRYGLASAIFVAIALVAERTLRLARRDLRLVARRRARALPEPDRLRLRARHDDRVDGRAAPRRDPDLRGADRARARARAAVAPLLVAARRLVRGRRARRARLRRRALGDLGGIAARARDRRDLGGLLGRDRAADGRYSPSRISAVVLPLGWVAIAVAGAPQTASQDYGARLGGLGAARLRDARAARAHERALVPALDRIGAVAGDARSRTCSRSSPRSSRSCSSRSR